MRGKISSYARNLENWIPIARDDTHRRSNAMKRRWACQGWRKTLCWSSKAAGQERVWRMANEQLSEGMNTKNEAAKLLQRFSGILRFGKRRLHLWASLTERPPKRMIFFLWIFVGNIFRDNVGASGYRGLQLGRKQRKEFQEWKIALGHREDDHEDPTNYPTQSY